MDEQPTENADSDAGVGSANDSGVGSATMVRPTKTPEKEKSRRRVPRYHVVLWNDDDHSYEYVVRMLKELFGHPEEAGFQLAKTVDAEGRVVVLTTTQEHAELKRDQIHAFGKDDLIKSCVGAMSASIEAAD